MQKNRIGNQKTIWDGLEKILAALAVMFAVVGSMQMVEAKEWYTLYDVRYTRSDIPSYVSAYIDYVEYDIPSPLVPGYDYGVRLYLTEAGKITLKQGGYPLTSVTYYVRSNSEWRSDRSFNSIANEIWWHVNADRTTVHIQYYYQDLEWWEKPNYGR